MLEKEAVPVTGVFFPTVLWFKVTLPACLNFGPVVKGFSNCPRPQADF